MSSSESLPTAADINQFDSLDERCAVKNFLGKTSDEAYAMFADNGLRFAEDLMWMAPRGLAFYLEPAIRYVMSSDATGDPSTFVSPLLGALAFRRTQNQLPASLIARMRDVASYIAANLAKFAIEPDEQRIQKYLAEILDD
jgi:hypothetical protein